MAHQDDQPAAGRSIWQLVRFLIVGTPAFAVAIPLNWYLVDRLGFPKSPTYALVLVCQTSVNFFLVRRFVFPESRSGNIARQFVGFVSGILVLRGLDWLVYSALVSGLGLHYILVQLGNGVVFPVLKFFVARRLMRPRERVPVPQEGHASV